MCCNFLGRFGDRTFQQYFVTKSQLVNSTWHWKITYSLENQHVCLKNDGFQIGISKLHGTWVPPICFLSFIYYIGWFSTSMIMGERVLIITVIYSFKNWSSPQAYLSQPLRRVRDLSAFERFGGISFGGSAWYQWRQWRQWRLGGEVNGGFTWVVTRWPWLFAVWLGMKSDPVIFWDDHKP